MALVLVIILLVINVPRIEVYNDEGKLKMSAKANLGWMVIYTFLVFFTLQATDPGYVDIDVSEQEEVAEKDNLLERGSRNLTKGQSKRKDNDRRSTLKHAKTMPDKRSTAVVDSSSATEDMVELTLVDKRKLDEDSEYKTDSQTIEYSSCSDTSDSEYELNSDEDYDIDFEPDENRDTQLSGVPVSKIPLRTKYCRQSRKFVAKYDHFCGIIGTCIGERNHFRFWLFLLGNTVMLCYGLAVVHSGFHDTKAEVGAWLEMNGHALAIAILLWILLFTFGGLFCFHCFLAMGSLTSYEFMRTEKISYLEGTRDFDLPFSRGLCTNLKHFVMQDGAVALLLGREWKPLTYKLEPFTRDSDNVYDNIWENKYWSCC